MNEDEYMDMALELSKKGGGFVSPNPMVGAVIVKEGKIIGQGFHEKYGGLHAERNALLSCESSPIGATMFVTLEPCCHFGKTPPCTDAIIESGISKVFVGTKDPNTLMSGKGIEKLKQKGIEVVTGVLEDQCIKLNEVFFHYITNKTPFVVMKYAMTLDGKIATSQGKSKWITGEKAREHVHNSRHRYSGIMVGVNTVIADNPMLTCRIPKGQNPTRIICDTNLRTPITSNLVQTAQDIPTFIATACQEEERLQHFTKKGCKIIKVSKKHEQINLNELMIKLGEEKIDSILLEGGSSLNFSALESGIVKKMQVYIAPKIFGGASAKTPVGGLGIENPSNAYQFSKPEITMIGDDILLECEVINRVYRDN